MLLWETGDLTVDAEVLRRGILGERDTALDLLRVADGADLCGLLAAVEDRCLPAVDLGLWVP